MGRGGPILLAYDEAVIRELTRVLHFEDDPLLFERCPSPQQFHLTSHGRLLMSG